MHPFGGLRLSHGHKISDALTCVRQTKTVGVDVGIETFGTCSDGEKIKSPKALKSAEKKLKKANAPSQESRKVARIVKRPASVWRDCTAR